MAGYSVTFSVVDQATRQIEAITRRIQQMRAPIERLSRSLARFADASGLKKVADGFAAIARAGVGVFASLSRLVPVMGAITGAASIAGMVRLVQTWGAWGVELQRTADSIGTSSQELQAFQNATTLAGGSAANMTESLKGLTDAAAGAFTGRNTEALQAFQQAGIKLTDANGKLRTTTELLPEVLRYLDAIKNPADRATAALRLGAASLYDLDEDFRRSGQTLGQWLAKARQITGLTADQIAAEQRYREAIGALDVSFQALEMQIGATLATAITPLLTAFNAFVTENSPAIIKAVDDTAAAFAAWLKSDDAARMLTGLEAIASTLASIVKIVGDIATAAAPIIKLLELTPTQAARAATAAVGNAIGRPAPGAEAPALLRGWGAAGDWLQEQLWPKSGQLPSPATARPAPLPSPARASPAPPPPPANSNAAPGVPYQAGALQTALRITPAQYDAFRNSVAGIESGGRYDLVGGSGGHFVGRYQLGGLGGHTEIADTARQLGERTPSIEEFRRNPQEQERYFEAYTSAHDRYLSAHSAKYRSLSPDQKLAVLGYAHNQGAGGAAKWLESGQAERDAFGTSADLYSRRIAQALAKLPYEVAGGAADVQAPRAEGAPAQVTGGAPVSGSVDVTITHRNPPAGAVVTAAATGDVNLAGPRTERQQLSAA
jgi:hypothetical protein